MDLSERLSIDLKRWLEEDVPFIDLTVESIKDELVNEEFVIIAKDEVFACSTDLIERALTRFNVSSEFRSGWVKGELALLKGDPRAILTLERTLLNFLTHVFSISTEVRKVRELLDSSGFSHVKLAVTRKTVPGMRLWAKVFASCAGADTHRFSLSDMLMLKDTHLGSVKDPLKAVQLAKERKSFAHKLEVEVRSREEALKYLPYADVIMLDNFHPEEAKRVACEIKKIRSDVIVEVSGGVKPSNVLEFLNECVDVVSMGYLTISPPRVDLSMRVMR